MLIIPTLERLRQEDYQFKAQKDPVSKKSFPPKKIFLH
jgi:hypothetical protein